MENFEIRNCSLCFNVVSDSGFVVIENVIEDIFQILLLKPSFEQDSPISCNTCFEKVLGAFEFKSTCISVDNTIMTSLEEAVLPVNIKDIYSKKQIQPLVDDLKVCRLCMKLIPGEFKRLQEIDTDLIQTCIPEVNFQATSNPEVCVECCDLLCVHTEFLTSCLNAQGQTKVKSEVYEIDGPFESSLNPLFKPEFIKIETGGYEGKVVELPVKKEEINIKLEAFECESPLPYTSIEIENDQIEQICIGEVIEEYVETYTKSEDVKKEEVDIKSEHDGHERPTSSLYSKIETIKNSNYYQKNLKQILANVESRNENVSKTYKCENCDYQSRSRSSLWNHRFKHNGKSKEKLFKCEECDYQTDRNYTLLRHQLTHREKFEVRTYKCDECGYEAKWKHALERHRLRQKHKSHLKILEYQIDLNSLLRENPEEKMYKCEDCDFLGKFKHDLEIHRLDHRSKLEENIYKCWECDYQTERRFSLLRHQIKHRDKSEIETFKCGECDYEAKWKHGLKRHRLTHKNKPSNVKIKVSDYLAKNENVVQSEIKPRRYRKKITRKRHKAGSSTGQLMHNDVSEMI